MKNKKQRIPLDPSICSHMIYQTGEGFKHPTCIGCGQLLFDAQATLDACYAPIEARIKTGQLNLLDIQKLIDLTYNMMRDSSPSVKIDRDALRKALTTAWREYNG